MSSASIIPPRSVQFTDWAKSVGLRIKSMGLTHISPIFEGGLIQCPTDPDHALAVEPGYVYHISVLQADPVLIRLLFVFFQDGTVQIRLPSYQPGHAVPICENWEEGLHRLFEKVAQTIEYTVGRSQGCARAIRTQLAELEQERLTIAPGTLRP